MPANKITCPRRPLQELLFRRSQLRALGIRSGYRFFDRCGYVGGRK